MSLKISTPWLAFITLGLLTACGGGSNSSDHSSHSGDNGPPPVEESLIDISAHCPVPTVARFLIETEGHEPVVSKEDYLRATVAWTDAQGVSVYDALSARIRGRGNSTWDMPKKPYKIKLDDRLGLLGLPAGKDWSVLANYADKSLLRNEVAFCIARTLGLPYTPDSAMLEITLNGSYDGLYQLTNKAYPIEDRMKEDAEQIDPADEASGFNDAFVLEMDWILRGDHWFYSVGGIPWNFDSDTDNSEQRDRIIDWINELESLILNKADPGRYDKVSERVDMQSLVDFFLVSELTANPDAYLSSTYAYRLKDGKLTFGPVWDFDQAQGLTDQNESPEGWLFERRSHSWYVQELLHEPRFRELLQSRWAWLSARVPSFRQFVLDSATALDAAQQRNFERWPILDELVFTNVVTQGSYAGEIDYLVRWMDERAAWMGHHIQALGQATQ